MNLPEVASKEAGKSHQSKVKLSDALTVAKKIGKLFGGGFDVPIMAYIMGCFHEGPDDHERVVESLSNEPVSEQLRDLPAVDPDHLEYRGHTEALRGSQILRDVVILQYPERGYRASTAVGREFAEDREWQKEKHAMESLKSDARVPPVTVKTFQDWTRLGQPGQKRKDQEKADQKA